MSDVGRAWLGLFAFVGAFVASVATIQSAAQGLCVVIPLALLGLACIPGPFDKIALRLLAAFLFCLAAFLFVQQMIRVFTQPNIVSDKNFWFGAVCSSIIMAFLGHFAVTGRYMPGYKEITDPFFGKLARHLPDDWWSGTFFFEPVDSTVSLTIYPVRIRMNLAG